MEDGRLFPSYNVEPDELIEGHKFRDLRFDQGVEQEFRNLHLESGSRKNVLLKRVALKDKHNNPVPVTDVNGKVVDGVYANITDKRMVGQLAGVLTGKEPFAPFEPLLAPKARIFSVTTKGGKAEHIILYSDEKYGNEFEAGLSSDFCSHYEIFPRELMEVSFDLAQFADKRVSVELWDHSSVLVSSTKNPKRNRGTKDTERQYEGPVMLEGYGYKRKVEALDGRNFVVMCAYDSEVMATIPTSE
ncbi:MAG: hypothetical protein ACPG5T_01655 [Endozoicomonas sp.]